MPTNVCTSIEQLRTNATNTLSEHLHFFAYTNLAYSQTASTMHPATPIIIAGISKENGAHVLACLKKYSVGILRQITLVNYIALFEDYYFSLIRELLLAYPKHLNKKQVELGVITTLSVQEIMEQTIAKELHDLSFKPVNEWFAYLEKILSSIGYPDGDIADELAEMKATRDIILHNAGVADLTYVRKSGSKARYSVGATVVIEADYLIRSYQVVAILIEQLACRVTERINKDA